MAKIIGVILILSSIFSIFVLAAIEMKQSNIGEATGNIIGPTTIQRPITVFDYIGGIIISYSISSFIVGVVFLFRV